MEKGEDTIMECYEQVTYRILAQQSYYRSRIFSVVLL